MGCCQAKAPRGLDTAKPFLPLAREYTFSNVSCGVVVTSCKGRRPAMEDVATVSLLGDKALGLAVFDGHSGLQAAEHASRLIWSTLVRTERWRQGDAAGALKDAFLEVDKGLLAGGVRAGTTATVAIVTSTEIVVAGVGDSRCVLCRSNMREVQLSVDHKPGLEGEEERILKAGGIVDRSDPRCARVVAPDGRTGIAITRALGDRSFKRDGRDPAEQILTAVPDVTTTARDAEDEFLIIASDGLWDVFKNAQAADYLRAGGTAALADNEDGPPQELLPLPPPPQQTAAAPELEKPQLQASLPPVSPGASRYPLSTFGSRCQQLVGKAIAKGSMDNVTAVVADLRRHLTAAATPARMERSPQTSSSPGVLDGESRALLDGGGGGGSGSSGSGSGSGNQISLDDVPAAAGAPGAAGRGEEDLA